MDDALKLQAKYSSQNSPHQSRLENNQMKTKS